MTRDPTFDQVSELQRLRDLARRIADPRDLGRHAHREIRRAVQEALAGHDPKPPETRCRTSPHTTR